LQRNLLPPALRYKSRRKVADSSEMFVTTYKNQAVPDFCTQFIPENVEESQATELYIIMGFHSHCLRSTYNPYSWAKKKIIVTTITVHSGINSTKGKC